MPRVQLRRSGSSRFLGLRRSKAAPAPQPFLPSSLCWSTNCITGNDSDDGVGSDSDDEEYQGGHQCDETAVFDFPPTQSQPAGEGGLSGQSGDAVSDENVWWKRHRLSQHRSQEEQEAISKEVMENIRGMLKQLEKIRQADRARQEDRRQMPPPSCDTTPSREQRGRSRPARKQQPRPRHEHPVAKDNGSAPDSPLAIPSSQYQVEMYAKRLPKPISRSRKQPLSTAAPAQDHSVATTQPSSSTAKRSKPASQEKLSRLPAILCSSRRPNTKRGRPVLTSRRTAGQFSDDPLNAYQDSPCSEQQHYTQQATPSRSSAATPASQRVVPVFNNARRTPRGKASRGGAVEGVATALRALTPRLGMSHQRSPLAIISSNRMQILNSAESISAGGNCTSARHAASGRTVAEASPAAVCDLSMPPSHSCFSPGALSVGNECVLPYTQSSDGSQSSTASKVNIYCSAVDDDDDESCDADQDSKCEESAIGNREGSASLAEGRSVVPGVGCVGSCSEGSKSMAAQDYPTSSQAWLSDLECSGKADLPLSQLSQTSSGSGKFKVPYRRVGQVSYSQSSNEE